MLNPLISVEVMAKEDSQHSNRFKYVDGNYICEISADNPIQMNDWIKAINLVHTYMYVYIYYICVDCYSRIHD